MSKQPTFIIALRGMSRNAPPKAGDFLYRETEQYECHIYQGKEFPLEEFNNLVPKVLDEYAGYNSQGPIPQMIEPSYPNLVSARRSLAAKRAKRALIEKQAEETKKQEQDTQPIKPKAKEKKTVSTGDPLIDKTINAQATTDK